MVGVEFISNGETVNISSANEEQIETSVNFNWNWKRVRVWIKHKGLYGNTELSHV